MRATAKSTRSNSNETSLLTRNLSEDNNTKKLDSEKSMMDWRQSFDMNKISILPSSNHSIQPKLTINQPNDKYEQEADKVADHVMRMHEVSSMDISSGKNKIQRKCEACEKEEDELRRKPQGADMPAHSQHAADPALQTRLNTSRGKGSALPGKTNEFMSHAMGTDFSHVRIHTGNEATELSNQINARAFTHGTDIYFNQGEYNTITQEGKHLLAHELTHILQQNSNIKQVQEDIDNPEIISRKEEESSKVEMLKNSSKLNIAPRNIIQRTPQRTCTARAGRGSTSTVTCSDGAEYDVTTLTETGIVPDTQGGVMAGLDRSTLYFQVRVCRGSDDVQIVTSMDIEPPLRAAITNILRGTTISSGIEFSPEMRITWERSGQFEAQVYGGPSFVEGAPRVGGRGGLRIQQGGNVFGGELGSDPTLTGPGGGPELHGRLYYERSTGSDPQVNCYRPEYTVSYRCTPITHSRPVEAIEPDDIQVYVFYDYANDTVIAPTPRFLRGNQEVSGVSLSSLAGQGYRAQSIDAFTSPEGRRGQPLRQGGFMGNDALSEARGAKAISWLHSQCQNCIDAEPPVNARSELYSAWRRPGVELEGDPLVSTARSGFLDSNNDPPTPDPLRRPEHDQLATLSLDQQRAQLYPLLRRAVIHLHRVGRPGTPSQRQRGDTGACPADVRKVMQQH